VSESPNSERRRARRPRLRLVLREFRPFRRDGYEAFGGIALAVGCQVASPIVVAYAINRGVVDRNTAIVGWCALAMLFLVAGQVGGSYFEQRAMGRFAQRYLADLRRRLLDHLHRLDLDYFAHEQAGRVVARLTSDVESLQQFLQNGLSLLVRGVLLVSLATVVMFTQSWQLSLAVLAILPVLAIASRWYRPRAFDVQLGFRESMANLLNHVNEALVGMRVVQAYGIESQQRGTFADINDATYDARMESGRVTSIYYAIIEFLHPVALTIVVGYGAVLADRGLIEVGTLIAFTLYLTRLFEPIQQFTELNTLLQAASAAFTRTFEFLAHRPSLADASDAVPFRPGPGVVRLERVTFRYAPDTPAAVSDLDLTVRPGERVAVVGTSGAGKSTLAKLVGRFYDPSAGRVFIDGQDLRTVASGSLRPYVVVVPQEGFLFDGTIADNIALGRPGATREEIVAACAELGFEGALARIPGGLDARVRNRGLTLSSGQRQLVALTRTFVADPSVVVLDEATSNLDPATDALIEHALMGLLAARTAIVIAHRVGTAQRADQVIVMEHGVVVEQGPPSRLEASEGPFARWVAAARAAISA
jgi:ATP-binding cassette, subfamily B, bacterial